MDKRKRALFLLNGQRPYSSLSLSLSLSLPPLSLSLQMGCKVCIAPRAKPILLLTSFCLVPSSSIWPPRYMNDLTCSRVWFSIWMLICVLFLPITWTWVFERLILRPSCELDLKTSETKVCRSSLDSASSAISSANLRLLITLPFMQAPMLESWSAWSMATSSNMLKSCGDMMQPFWVYANWNA